MARPVALLLAAALALGACGGDGEAGTTASVKLDSAGLQAVEQLAPADVRAIERLYRAGVDLEDSEAATRPTEDYEEAMRPSLVACQGLDAAHPLLGVMRASCPALGALHRGIAGVGTCEADDKCRAAALGTVAALRDLVAGSRLENRAVRATRLARACKRVLTTPRSAFRVYARFDAALERFATAMESGTDDDHVAALTTLAAVDVGALGSARSSLRRFRAHCR